MRIHVRRRFLGVLIGGLSVCSLAFGDTLLFNIGGTSSGLDLGSTSKTYTLDGISVPVVGFNGGDLAAKKNGGGSDENGLGLTGDPSRDNEIYHKSSGTQDFIQVDVGNLLLRVRRS